MTDGARGHRRAERRRAAQATVRAAMQQVVPVLDDGAIDDLLGRARASTAMPLYQLADHLVEHPDALLSGDPCCPLVLIRLTHVLHEAGHVSVVRPGCADCGRLTADMREWGPAGRLCMMCSIRTRSTSCARCGRTAIRIAARRAEGGICGSCYRCDPAVVEDCGRCGRRRMPVTRREDGAPLCDSCSTRTARRCEVCGRCGQLRALTSQLDADGNPVCRLCSLGPDRVCAGCAQIRPCRRHGPAGRWLCSSCLPNEAETCSRCARPTRIHIRWPLGPLCAPCRGQLLDAPRPCARCDDVRVLIARDDCGEGICGPCFGVDVDPRCEACGRPGRHYEDGRCAHCVLGQRLDELLAGPDGEVSAPLRPIRDALAGARHPRGLMRELVDSPRWRLLAELLATGDPVTHARLDELAPGPDEFYVRQLLVHAGVLPERDDDLERLPPWLDQVLADVPAEHARLIRPFVHWFLLRRARRGAPRRRQPAVAGPYLRSRVRVALGLLSWLDQHDIALQALDQPTLEGWLARGNADSYRVRFFLYWAATHDLVPRLSVPRRPQSAPERILDDTDRWALLRRCLTDETMPLDTRAAAALILLYGLPLSRVRHLRIDQLDLHGPRRLLRIGRCPLALDDHHARLRRRRRTLRRHQPHPPPRAPPNFSAMRSARSAQHSPLAL